MMNPRRTLLKTLAALGLFGPAGLSGLLRTALAAGNKPVAPGLRRMRGEVTINGVAVRTGQPIGFGDTIATGRDGEAIYVIGQDAFLQRENSIVSFGTDAATNLMRVVSGKILSVFGKGPRTIRVSTATIGVRGTGCYIEDEPDAAGISGELPAGRAGATPANSRTYFCLCYGSVELTPDAAPQERVTYSTTHHEHPLYIHNDMKMPHAMVPAAVINHTDDELTLLENLVGRWPPFFDGSSRSRY